MARSISPVTLKDVVNESGFVDLISCFESYSKSYAMSQGQIDLGFIKVFRCVVEPNIRRSSLLVPYLNKLILYRKLASYKIDLVLTTLQPYFTEMSNKLRTMTTSEIETQMTNFWTARNGMLCTSISQLFFSIEHCCKIACCLANAKLASKVARGIPVNHGDIFQVLRDLGRQGFLLDFDSLKRTYAYVMKTRMAADYTEFFYEQFDVNPFVPVLLGAAIDILNSQKQLLFECAGI
jgi:hypothetical protein